MTPPPQSVTCPGEHVPNPQVGFVPQSTKHDDPSVHTTLLHLLAAVQSMVQEEPLQIALSVKVSCASIWQVAPPLHVTSHLLGCPSHVMGQKLDPSQASSQLLPVPASSRQDRWHEQSVGHDAEHFCPTHPLEIPAQHCPSPQASQAASQEASLHSGSPMSVVPSQSLSKVSVQLSG